MGKTLVTGADGFIGSHLVESLVRKGHDVRAFTMYQSSGSWGWLDMCAPDAAGHFEVVAGDIRDSSSVFNAVQGCDAVLHLAALIGIPYSYEAPASYVDTNISGTLNILNAARSLDVSKVVHTSTSEVYGTAQSVPITELHPLVGQSPYSATKIAADQLALSFHHSFETPVVVIRPFNTYGPRQSARAVIPTVITQLSQGDRRVKLGSIHPTRDFVFVDDTVEGFVKALHSENCEGQVIQLGSGFEISVGDTVAVIARLMGQEVEIITDHDRLRPVASEVERLWADNRKARDLLAWSPEYGSLAGFESGLRTTIDWFMEAENIARYKVDRYMV